jgi:hypothetical protein
MTRYQRNIITIGLLALLLVLCQGCSKRAWFRGFVAGQQFQCNKLSGPELTRCRDAIITDYDRYKIERQQRLHPKQ